MNAAHIFQSKPFCDPVEELSDGSLLLGRTADDEAKHGLRLLVGYAYVAGFWVFIAFLAFLEAMVRAI